MSVQTEITRIAQAKTDIKNVVNSKVANTITNQTIDAFPPLIDSSIAAYKNLIPWIEGSGSSFTIGNAEAGKLDKFEMYGNTHQDSYTGKNKLPYTNDINETINSTKITGVKGTYTIQTTPTATVYQTYVNLVENYTIQSGDYLHIMNDVANANITFNLKCTDDTILSPTLNSLNRIFDLSSYVGKTISSIRFYVSTSYDGAKITLTPMIVNSPTTTEWEQFTFGASSNPDYPQPIEVVTGDNTINVHGKNLNKTSITVNLTSGSEKWIGTRLEEVNWENGKTYYIKAFLEKQSNEVVQITNYGYKSIDNKQDTIVFNGNIPYVRVGANTLNANITDEEVKIMVSTETFTDFEPYQGKDYEINLGDIELCKIGDYQDYIYKENNKWYKHSEIGKVVLDGSENWNRTENTNYTKFSSNSIINNSNATGICLSSHFILGTDQSGRFKVYNNNWINIFTRIMTLQEFKTWLSNNNVIIYYACTPTDTEITDTTLINQLEAIETETGTNIFEVFNENNVLPDLYVLTEKKDSYKN